jgi:hypothetical protein
MFAGRTSLDLLQGNTFLLRRDMKYFNPLPRMTKPISRRNNSPASFINNHQKIRVNTRG